MATLNAKTLGFSYDSAYRHYGQVWYSSDSSPVTQLVYLFKDSSNNYHVGIYNGNAQLNISSCPSANDISYFSTSNAFNLAKSFFTDYGVNTSSWSYNMTASTVYFDASVTSNSSVYEVDITNAHVIDRSSFASMCSSVVANNTYYRLVPSYTFEIEESSSTTDLTIPILMIPATILVVCFFSIIYRMFMNRKVRG